MKRNPQKEFQYRTLFWLFRKRLVHETRKYTAGIILTAGVTALFISMLIVGSSFLSASFRATGAKGPRIFDIKYSSPTINITLEMPRSMNITCGVSDFYPVDQVRLYYSTNFMITSIPLNGTRFETNLSGQYYRFTIEFGEFPEPKTYLFFMWANNSAGYFTYDDNNRYFYSVRLQTPTEQNPIDSAALIQRLEIGIDNATTTRNPRPAIKVWINETSSAWIKINAYEFPHRSGARFYSFIPTQDLSFGVNNISIFIQQDKIYTKNFTITWLNTSLALTKLYPANGSTVLNQLDAINFTVNDWVTCNVSLMGPVNLTWSNMVPRKSFSLRCHLNSSFGNYSLSIHVLDYYSNVAVFTMKFTFAKSLHPYITILSPMNWSSLVNTTISIRAELSEACNVSVENMNTSYVLPVYQDVTNGSFSGLPVIPGWNFINVTATNAEGMANSSIFKVKKQPYIIHSFNYDVFVIPGEQLHINVNFSTNYTASTSGQVWYSFDYSGSYVPATFQPVNTTSSSGVLRGILQAVINVPTSVSNVLFNFTLNFGPEPVHFDQSGHDFHVPVEYLYKDLSGPVVRDIRIGPVSNEYSTHITSNDNVAVVVNLYDVTGVRNVSLIYSLNSNLSGNTTLNMTYRSGGSNWNGYWNVTIPPHLNASTIYCKIVMYDVLNNSASYIAYYSVYDTLNANLDQVIPGLLNPDYKQAIIGAITTLLVIMILIIAVFLVIFIALNDQNVKREMFREEDRIFILKHVCKLSPSSIKKYYYIEQLVQDSIGYVAGTALGFLLLGPLFVGILKVTMVAWTFDFQDLYYFSFITLESWVGLLLLLFILSALLLKLIQVDKYVAKMAY
nr:hypothetical protein [Candidatus Sigynarchaeota archaeon]